VFRTTQKREKREVKKETTSRRLRTGNRAVLGYQFSSCGSRSSRREEGTAILEGTLLLALFLTLTIGLIDFGIGVWEYNTVAHLARQGTRYAMVNSAAKTNIQIQDWVKDRAQDLGLTRAGVTVTATWLPADKKPGSVVTVAVQYNYTPIAHLFTGGPVVLHATSKTVVSQ
jgi:Flp pilus assembly protein TadG